MRIYKCDRCGKELGVNDDIMPCGSISLDGDGHHDLHELCLDCLNKFRDEIADSLNISAETCDNSGKWKSNDIFPEYTIDDRGLVEHHYGTKLLSAKIKIKDSIVTLIGSYWGIVLDPEKGDYQRHYFTPYKVEQGNNLNTFVAKRNWNKLINLDDVVEWDYFDLV